MSGGQSADFFTGLAKVIIKVFIPDISSLAICASENTYFSHPRLRGERHCKPSRCPAFVDRDRSMQSHRRHERSRLLMCMRWLLLCLCSAVVSVAYAEDAETSEINMTRRSMENQRSHPYTHPCSPSLFDGMDAKERKCKEATTTSELRNLLLQANVNRTKECDEVFEAVIEGTHWRDALLKERSRFNLRSWNSNFEYLLRSSLLIILDESRLVLQERSWPRDQESVFCRQARADVNRQLESLSDSVGALESSLQILFGNESLSQSRPSVNDKIKCTKLAIGVGDCVLSLTHARARNIRANCTQPYQRLITSANDDNTTTSSDNASCSYLLNVKKVEKAIHHLRASTCLLQTFHKLLSHLVFVALSNELLRLSTFGRRVGVPSRRKIVFSGTSMVCKAAFEKKDTTTHLYSQYHHRYFEDDEVEMKSAVTFLYAWLKSTRPSFALLAGIAEDRNAPYLTMVLNTTQSNKSSLYPLLCAQKHCPHPLTETKDPSHSITEEVKGELVQTLLSFAPPSLHLSRRRNSSQPFCGHECRDPTLAEDDVDKIYAASAVSGVLSLVISVAAVATLFLFRKRSSCVIPPIHLTIYMNIALFPLACLIAVSSWHPSWRRIACFDDGILRWKEPRSFNSCAVVAAISMFFLNTFSFIIPLMALKWHNLAKKVSSDMRAFRRKNSSSKLEIILFFCALALSGLFTGLGLSRKNVMGSSALFVACFPGVDTFLYFVGIPFMGSSLVATSALFVAARKIFARLHSSRQHREFLRMDSSLRRFRRASVQSSTSVKSFASIKSIRSIGKSDSKSQRRRKRVTARLKMLINVFLLDIAAVIMVTVVMILNITLSWADSREDDHRLSNFLHCLVSSCRAEDCRPLALRYHFPPMAVVTPLSVLLGIAACTLPVFFVYRKVYLAEISKLYLKLTTR